MKRFSHISFLLTVLFFMTGIQPLWAGITNYSIDILQGSGPGFSYSGIHAATGCPMGSTLLSCGDKIYWPLTGTLIADRDDTTFELSNLQGTLTTGVGSPQNGSMQIWNGSLTGTGGSFEYLLTGGSLNGEQGTFYFSDGSPNNLTATGFTLWGNNWLDGENGPAQGTPIGIDLVGGNYVVNPEPSTILLMGTGLLALPFLRKKKAA